MRLAVLLLLCAVLAAGGSKSPKKAADEEDFDSWVVVSFSGEIAIDAAAASDFKIQSHKVSHASRKPTADTPEIYTVSRTHKPNEQNALRASLRAAADENKQLDTARVFVEPNVRYRNQQTEPTAYSELTASWALDRINQPHLPLDGHRTVASAWSGQGQHVHVLDTGIYSHGTFLHPVRYEFSSVKDGNEHADCNGHGTHVAGLIASTVYGVAPNVTLHAWRVLGCDGSGFLSDILDALKMIVSYGRHPSVINLSMSASTRSEAMATMVASLVNTKGSIVVAASGNDGSDACSWYPGGYDEAVTVGALVADDTVSRFSNNGRCVDLYAPGSSIRSCGTTSPTSSVVMSGTSMASPIVAGASALLLQRYGNGFEARQRLVSDWTTLSIVRQLLVNIVPPLPSPTPAQEPEPVPQPAPEPEPVPEPVVAPEPAPMPAPVPAPSKDIVTAPKPTKSKPPRPIPPYARWNANHSAAAERSFIALHILLALVVSLVAL